MGLLLGEWSCTLLQRKSMAMKLEWEHQLSQDVVEEIIDALTVVHQSGIPFGDIRPSNILVAKGQQVGARLIDFGFARPISSSEDCTRKHAQLESLLNECIV
ncbi:hypothetical protein KC19_10G077100 [Ceratodon purpureus]|uniref:Protein kinase domain-containing protein n=1 Tax=Ceratodon purpureus TaxID=3225 RepID=A0A8T0GKK8_CERPU|nr:hypothetical protein KC19_10G077100 [Ceratodon purpureus]